MINFYFWRYFGENPFGHSGRRIADSTQGWSVISAALRSGSVFAERSTNHHPVHDALGNAEALIRLLNGER